jgi:alginate O-acetyltransferase complex protein AlgI
MIFNSLTFILFLAIVIPLYWHLGDKSRPWLILGAGMVFYGFWRFDFLFLLFASITFDYFSGIIIADTKSELRRKLCCVVSLVINISLIVGFKYSNFILGSLSQASSFLGFNLYLPEFAIVLPIGISFYTFHAMSYIVDVYRGHIRPVRGYLTFCNYVIFFPQLVAGPILRAGEMIWQLERRPRFSWSYISYGLERILSGLFLKVVLADNLARYVNESYAIDPSKLYAIDTLTLGFLFGFQIYFDFSGYSHIAVGVARLMGITFPENFNFPYLVDNPRMFWRRWHISLSSWIRDYIYLPIAGVKVADRNSEGGIGIDGTGQIGRNNGVVSLFITWAIMGLWHGAAWTFVLWGVWHALLVQGHRIVVPIVRDYNGRFFRIVGWAFTITTIMLGWIPFRAPSLQYSLEMWSHLIDIRNITKHGLRESTYLVAAVIMLGMLISPIVYKMIINGADRWPRLIRPICIIGWGVVAMLVVVYLRPINQFIYFQF